MRSKTLEIKTVLSRVLTREESFINLDLRHGTKYVVVRGLYKSYIVYHKISMSPFSDKRSWFTT